MTWVWSSTFSWKYLHKSSNRSLYSSWPLAPYLMKKRQKKNNRFLKVLLRNFKKISKKGPKIGGYKWEINLLNLRSTYFSVSLWKPVLHARSKIKDHVLNILQRQLKSIWRKKCQFRKRKYNPYQLMSQRQEFIMITSGQTLLCSLQKSSR